MSCGKRVEPNPVFVPGNASIFEPRRELLSFFVAEVVVDLSPTTCI